MAINPLKAFLFTAGGSVAVVGTAYVSGALDPYLHPKPPAQVSTATPPADKPAPEAPAAGEKAPAGTPAAEAPKQEPPAAQPAAAQPAAATEPHDQRVDQGGHRHAPDRGQRGHRGVAAVTQRPGHQLALPVEKTRALQLFDLLLRDLEHHPHRQIDSWSSGGGGGGSGNRSSSILSRSTP